MARYTVVLTPEAGGGFSVTVPALPGCFSQGETVEESLDHIREAIGLHLWGLEQDGDPIPTDVDPIIQKVDAEPLSGHPPTAELLRETDPAGAGAPERRIAAMSALRYTILIYPDEQAYSVVVPALPGCVTWGTTLDEAVSSAREAIEGHVAALRDTGHEARKAEATPLVATVEIEAPIRAEATA